MDRIEYACNRERHLERTEKIATALFRQLGRTQWRDDHGRLDFATLRFWFRVTRLQTNELLRLLGPTPPLPTFQSHLDGCRNVLDRLNDAEFETLCEMDMREAKKMLDLYARRRLRGHWNDARRLREMRRRIAVPPTDPKSKP